MGAVALAEGGSDLSGFISSLTSALSDFSTSNLATVLVSALGITVGLVLAWFAYRWVVKRVSSALKKGKL